MKKRRTPRKPGEHQIKQELKHIPREWRRTSKKAGEAMRNTGDSERNTKKRRRAIIRAAMGTESLFGCGQMNGIRS